MFIKQFNDHQFRFVQDGELFLNSQDLVKYLGYSQYGRAWYDLKSASPDVLSRVRTFKVLTSDKKRRSIDHIPFESICLIIQKTQKLSAQQKKEVLTFLAEVFEKDINTFLLSRNEIEFGDLLTTCLPFFYIQKQYVVGLYRLDFYIPQLNIAIEYDEAAHSSKVEEDKFRQKFIEKEIGCTFIRVPDSPKQALSIVMTYLFANGLLSPKAA